MVFFCAPTLAAQVVSSSVGASTEESFNLVATIKSWFT